MTDELNMDYYAEALAYAEEHGYDPHALLRADQALGEADSWDTAAAFIDSLDAADLDPATTLVTPGVEHYGLESALAVQESNERMAAEQAIAAQKYQQPSLAQATRNFAAALKEKGFKA